jgi:hypothetical protein
MLLDLVQTRPDRLVRALDLALVNGLSHPTSPMTSTARDRSTSA